jgi:tripartite-type tricarboxylate transporter receptor subunit TctC
MIFSNSSSRRKPGPSLRAHWMPAFAGMTIVMLLLFAVPALAQDYPTRSIHFIVGPGPDSLARVLGQKMTDDWHQPVLVDQRGGGGGTISAELVAHAPADGYTILLATGTHTINPSLYKVSYDIVKDFAPVTLAAAAPFILGVYPSVPVHTLAELIADAKAHPGQLNYGSGGSGTPPHLATELLKMRAGINLVHIPYKTVPEAITDLIAGRVQVMFMVGPAGLPQVKAGTVRAIAVSTAKRSVFLPDMPTVAEQGFPGFNVLAWNGILAPAGTPAPVIARLHDEIVAILKEPDVVQRIAGFGFEPIGNSPQEFGDFVKAEVAQWANVAKESGAKVD